MTNHTTTTDTPAEVFPSGLAAILRRAIPDGTYDPTINALRYPMPQELIKRAGSDAECSVVSLSIGLAVVGQMMMADDAARELSPHDIHALGAMLATIAETINELHQVASWASWAVGEGEPQ